MAQPVSLYYDSQPQLLPPAHRRLPQLSARPRSYNGRFLPETDFNRKVCGWCNTQTTSQWRVGCATGSEAMKTLCNACGISYHRTQRKVPNLVLDLDVLAQNHSNRLSILKEFKRQRKLSPALDRFKTKPRKLIHRARPRSSNLNMLLSDSAPLLSRQPPAAPMHTLTTLIPPASVPTRRTFTSTCFPLVPAQPLSSLVPHSPHTRYRLPSFKEVTRNLSQMNL
ncbi:hypothetical protein BWQ96_02564 [Gracilariopsis chorda]|uniref:GATA-type domain-containing protein n=1 Tax=Gracilariopsis chorda TaxID=448386 RepID=A0A2V3IZW5_9FLOR|nr:hypothetical protein BWQ96_02564 [Gracilariopsis chorda]|eukprot:PXF47702.1 hypothetical protein BWQ96_02564 [Gracilariopsis chorda]